MNALDRLIGYVAPVWGAQRLAARATMEQIDAFTGGPDGPYAAANQHQATGRRPRRIVKENQVAPERLNRMRADAWEQFRDNPYTRKIVRSLQSKVVGKGMLPESLATNADGTPAVEFRARAKELWLAIQSGFDSRGMPGQGGVTFAGQQRLALSATILSGNCLYRLKPIDQIKADQRALPVPMTLQLIDADRLADQIHANDIAEGHTFERGIEFDADGERFRYWLKPPSNNGVTSGDPIKIPAAEMFHLYTEDDIDQILGSTWFAATLIGMRDIGDIEFNYQKATAMASCVVMGVRLPTGKTRFGLNAATETQQGTSDGTDLTDVDGNTVNKMQPGMIIGLGKDGALESVSPNIQTGNAESFLTHKLRATAGGLPGVKSSTVTGDYRNSSFSSERSADNDCWPEIEALQEWFASGFCQPIFSAVVKAAVASGYFDGIVTAGEFNDSPGRYLAAKWQGPIQLSINPVDDTNAAALRMHHGLSSLQMECAKVSVNWRDVLRDNAELRQAADEADLPPEFINNVFGVDAQDVIAQNIVATGGGQPSPFAKKKARNKRFDPSQPREPDGKFGEGGGNSSGSSGGGKPKTWEDKFNEAEDGPGAKQKGGIMDDWRKTHATNAAAIETSDEWGPPDVEHAAWSTYVTWTKKDDEDKTVKFRLSNHAEKGHGKGESDVSMTLRPDGTGEDIEGTAAMAKLKKLLNSPAKVGA